jgi:hypothetical protein
MGPLGESGGSLVGKGDESDVKSLHHHIGSPRLCRIRNYELALTSKY